MHVREYVYDLMNDRMHGLLDRLFQLALWIISIAYGFLAFLRRLAYRIGFLRGYQSPKPVISVGNLTLGGVGKTPLVIMVAQALQQRELRPAVLIRGYMPKEGMTSDEASMLKDRLPGVPIITGADRRLGIEDCLKCYAVDVFVCDDAFGHLQLRRDLNIVVIDAVNPFGNQHVLPRGILREPLAALEDADILMLTKTDNPKADMEGLGAKLKRIAPKALIAGCVHQPKECVDVFERTRVGLDHFRGNAVIGFCGIGDPLGFKHALVEAGFNVLEVVGFMDHHVYGLEDVERLRKIAKSHHVQTIITTHKDAVKLVSGKEQWDGFKLYYLSIDLEITHGKNAFLERILHSSRR